MSKMSAYIKRLEELDPAGSLMTGKRKLLLFFSGSSHLETAALTAGQLQFLQAVCPRDYSLIESNFPFHSQFEHRQEAQVSLLEASLSNIAYYWHTLYNARFQKELDRHLGPLLLAQEAIVICKSSGLNLLTQWLSGLEEELPVKLTVVALGPVSRRLLERADIDLLTIKGLKDPYSKYLDSHPATIWLDSNHFDYEYRKDVRNIIYEKLGKED